MSDTYTRSIDFTAQYNAGNAIDDRHFESEFDGVLDAINELLRTVTSAPTSLARGDSKVLIDPVAGITPILYFGDQDGDPINILTDVNTTLASLSGTITSGALIQAGDIVIKTLQTSGGELVDSVPTGYLECDGSAVSRTTYATLYTALGDAAGEGDGSTTFNIPDLRGQFIRGWDHGAGLDPDAATRTALATGGNTGDNVLSEEADQNKSHTHTIPFENNCTLDGTSKDAVSGGETINSGSSGGDEARPTNVNVIFCIKY